MRKRGATATYKKQSVPRALEHTVLPFTANITCKRMRSSTREVRFALSWSKRELWSGVISAWWPGWKPKKDSFCCTVRRRCAALQARLQVEAHLKKHLRTQESWDSVRQMSS